MKLSVLFRGGALATIVAATLLVSGLRSAAAAETKAAKKVDLNRATPAQLEELPGIGPALAKKIVAHRPYKSVDDLSKAGISATEIRKINALVTIGPAYDPAPSKEAKPLSKTGKPALVDLNKATAKQLEELPSVDSGYAKKIMAARPYKTVDDLKKAGIPSATTARIKSLVTVDSAKQTYTVAKPIDTDTKPRAIDLNKATESTLEEVPGIGSAYAKKIVAGRPYKSVDDLVKAGIPPSTVDKLRTVVAVGRPFEAPPEKGMVWVNLDSKRYHKEGSAWYGKTKNGKYMSEADAIKAGYEQVKTRAKKG
jgi:DNA uptake protein ComE-like DNA-binding protein